MAVSAGEVITFLFNICPLGSACSDSVVRRKRRRAKFFAATPQSMAATYRLNTIGLTTYLMRLTGERGRSTADLHLTFHLVA